MKLKFSVFFAFLLLAFYACKKSDNHIYNSPPEDAAAQAHMDTTLRMNQIQVIASHNSYRLKTYQPIYDKVLSLGATLPDEYNPNDWDYTHIPFNLQFDQYGVRGLEIDIYNDPHGGQFYNRFGNSFFLGEPAASDIPELQQPGFKVLHIPDLDYMTNYYSFKSALQSIKTWSDAHPKHVPLFIYIESKDGTVADIAGLDALGFTPAIPYDASSPDALDNEIKSVFGQNLEKVISPDEVRGNYNTLREAVIAGNWPKLGEARGKVIFVMSGGMVSLYKQGRPSFQGRACFAFADANSEEAAFIILNDAIDDENEIKQKVSEGFIVRTRADGSTDAARTGDYSKMEAAFRSGAQIVSTDYYKPDERAGQPGWTNYQVKFPNNELARINRVSAAEQVRIGIIRELP